MRNRNRDKDRGQDRLGQDTKTKCGALILDITLKYCVVVHENSRPCRKKGFPKGSRKKYETPDNCVFREVKEEINVDISKLPYTIIGGSRNHKVIHIQLEHTQVVLTPDGEEVIGATWTLIDKLIADVDHNPGIYNRSIRKWFWNFLITPRG